MSTEPLIGLMQELRARIIEFKNKNCQLDRKRPRITTTIKTTSKYPETTTDCTTTTFVPITTTHATTTTTTKKLTKPVIVTSAITAKTTPRPRKQIIVLELVRSGKPNSKGY